MTFLFQSVFDLELIKREQADKEGKNEEKRKRENRKKNKQTKTENNEKLEKDLSPGNGGKERRKDNAETNEENTEIEKDGKGEKDDKKKNLKIILKKETPEAEPKNQEGIRSTEVISSNENMENRPKLKHKEETTLRENLYQDFLSKVTIGPIKL